MTPTYQPDGNPTYHADATVSYWDVFRQQWQREPAANIRDEVHASYDDEFRALVARMASTGQVFVPARVDGDQRAYRCAGHECAIVRRVYDEYAEHQVVYADTGEEMLSETFPTLEAALRAVS